MDTPENLIDAIYGRFVLRDALGKMVPGLIAIAAAAFALVPVNQLGSCVQKMPLCGWLGVAGLSWVVAFAIQSFGEWSGWIKYLPPNVDRPAWYANYMEFRTRASPAAVREHERLVVIMEVCGNTSIAFFAAFSLLVADAFLDAAIAASFWESVWDRLWLLKLPFLLLLLSTWLLFRMHREHRSRHYDILQAGLRLLPQSPTPTSPPQVAGGPDEPKV